MSKHTVRQGVIKDESLDETNRRSMEEEHLHVAFSSTFEKMISHKNVIPSDVADIGG